MCATQHVSGIPTPKHFSRPTLPVHFIENYNVALTCMKQLGVNTAGVTAEGPWSDERGQRGNGHGSMGSQPAGIVHVVWCARDLCHRHGGGQPQESPDPLQRGHAPLGLKPLSSGCTPYRGWIRACSPLHSSPASLLMFFFPFTPLTALSARRIPMYSVRQMGEKKTG